jgi:hypothetical protein
VYGLQQALALIDAHPLLALPDAAEEIADRIGADFVGCAPAAAPSRRGPLFHGAAPDCEPLGSAAARRLPRRCGGGLRPLRSRSWARS